MFQEFLSPYVKIAIGLLIIFVIYSGCTHPENKSAKKGETSEFEFSLAQSDIKEFKADERNVMNFTTYSPFPELGFFEGLVFRITNSVSKEDLENAKKEHLFTDIENKRHDSAISFTIDPSSKISPYIIVEMTDIRGELGSYDSFKGTLSIVPEQDFYDKPINTIKTEMNFYFFNEKQELLGKYTIDSQKTKSFEIDLKESKKLYVVAETDYEELFIGAILSPRLVKK